MKKILLVSTVAIAVSFSLDVTAAKEPNVLTNGIAKIELTEENLMSDETFDDKINHINDKMGISDDNWEQKLSEFSFDKNKTIITQKNKIKKIKSKNKDIIVVSQVKKIDKSNHINKIKDSLISITKKEEPILDVSADNNDQIFMSNMPEGTRLIVLKSFTVLPKKSFIIFKNGFRVSNIQMDMSGKKDSFCYIELIKSGNARILKSDKVLIITKNKDSRQLIASNYHKGKSVKVYKSVFYINNKNIKNITCSSFELFDQDKDKIPAPLTIKDFNRITGKTFKIDFPAYEEI